VRVSLTESPKLPPAVARILMKVGFENSRFCQCPNQQQVQNI
jgi:hypothetical protein